MIVITKNEKQIKETASNMDSELASYRLNGHEFEQALGVDDGQGTLHAAAYEVTKNWT